VCPISCAAVQNRIRCTHGPGFASPAGACEMKDSLKMAQPCRWAVPMSSNMIPPSPVPMSCWRAKSTQTAHCGASFQRDQWASMASCISWSDQVVLGPAPAIGTALSPPVLVTRMPSRA